MAKQRAVARRKAPPARKVANPWLWVLPVMAAALVAIVVFGLMRGDTGSALSGIGDPVPADVLAAVTNVPESAWTSAGTTGARLPVPVPPTSVTTPALPQVLYIGAEFCPYCASQRWPLIVALSRFGQFQGLKLTTSSSTDSFPDTPSFTFYGASYSSQYLRLATVESAGRAKSGGSYPTLETPSASQELLFRRYNAPPYVPAQSARAIPFLMIGEKYLWVGASVAPEQLQGKTWQAIAGGLAIAQDQVGQSIIGNANVMTASICRVTKCQPAEVCANPGVKAADKLLSTSGSR